MDVFVAYREVGTYRGAAVMCGTTHKTVRRIIEGYGAGERPGKRVGRARNYDVAAGVVARRVESTRGRISAKRLLPEARAAGYGGSA
ncbi:MAG: IS21 family transposase, partial [Actinobacteria bacterium]|nr:IS21 family transposase [Actinomycetota bacterium]